MLSGIAFGNFTAICQEVALPVCYLWSTTVKPTCVTGGLSIGGANIKNFGDFLIAIIAALMMLVMIYRTFSKVAAVGRKEMIIVFFYYFLTQAVHAATGSGLISQGTILQTIASVEIGLLAAFFWSLLLNGLVGFQFVEDGGVISVTGVILSSLALFIAGTLFSLDAGQQILGGATSSDPLNSTFVFAVYTILPIACVIFYVILQTVLVTRNLGDQKPLISLYLGAFLFALSQVFTFVLNQTICTGTSNSIDGTVFATLANLASIIFVYRFWDSITEDDWDNIDDIFV